MKKVLIVVGLAAVAAGAWLAFRGGEASEQETVENDAKTKVRRIGAAGEMSLAREKIEAAAAAITNSTRRASARVRMVSGDDVEEFWVFEDGTPWPEPQKELMRAISAAADNEDFEGVRAFAAEVAKCENAEIREKFVEELGWFGEKALVELANFISDPSEDVADAARTQITDAFQEIDSDAEKAAIFSLMSKAVTDDDLLETFADELVVMDEVLALQTIVDTIADGTPKAKKAVQEAYETITDEKWKDLDSAEKWLESNYEDGDGDSDDSDVAESDHSANSSRKAVKSDDSKSEKKSSRSSTSRSSGRGISSTPTEDSVQEGGSVEEGETVESDADVDAEGESESEIEDLDGDGLPDEEPNEEDGEVDEFGNPIPKVPAPVLVD